MINPDAEPHNRNSLIDKAIRILFYALILLVPLAFFTNLTQNPFFIQITLLNIIVPIIIILYLLNAHINKEFGFLRTQMDLPLIFLVGICMFSVIGALVKNPHQRTAVFIMGFDNIIFLVLNWISVFYTTVYVLKRAGYVDKVINLTLMVGALASFYGILQYMGFEPVWSKTIDPFGGRSVSTFGNPNFLASFLVLLIPVSLIKTLLSKNNISRISYLAISTIMFSALVCASTRSAWIGFIVSLAVMWLFLLIRVRNKKMFLTHVVSLVIVFTVGLVVVMSSPKREIVGSRALSAFSVQKSGVASSQRFLIWEVARDMFVDNPVLGIGWGTFELFYPGYQGKYLESEKYGSLKTHANRAHNEILQFLSETGVAGFAVSIWVIIVFFAFSIKSLKRIPGEEKDSYIMIGLLSGITGMLVDNLFNVSLHFASPAMVFWINMGIVIHLGGKKESYNKTVVKEQSGSLSATRIMVSIARIGAMAVLMGIIWLNATRFMAAVHYFDGFKYFKGEPRMLDKASISFEKSFSQYPFDVNTNYELANVYACQERKNEAINHYMKALLVNPGYAEIHYNIGLLYVREGETNKGIYHLEEAMKIEPNSLETAGRLGTVYLSLKKWNEARRVYEKIVTLMPDSSTAHIHLGNIYFNLNEAERAIGEYRKVIELNPSSPAGYKNMGYAYMKTGKNAQAVQAFREVLERNPEDAEVKAVLGELGG
ncbi:MAG: tetratricopeptide repeat protein [bacterium]